MGIKVLYFGRIAEICNTTSEIFTDVIDVDALKNAIHSKYNLLLSFKYKVSINNKIYNENRMLNNGDEIALLPPFSGG